MDNNGISLLPADHGARNRRGNGNLSLLNIRLIDTHNLIADLGSFFQINERNGGSKNNLVRPYGCRVNNVGPRQFIRYMLGTPLNKGLFLLGGMIFRIF